MTLESWEAGKLEGQAELQQALRRVVHDPGFHLGLDLARDLGTSSCSPAILGIPVNRHVPSRVSLSSRQVSTRWR